MKPFFLFLTSLALAGSAAAAPPPATNEYVILLAGLNGSTLNMKRIEWNLRRAGYHVINLPYRSHYGGIAALATHYLAPAVVRLPANARIHFVTHSLGAIILRQYLSAHPLPNLGRVVMIAPPNAGTPIVDFFRRRALGRLFLGPAGCELGTQSTDTPRRLGQPDFSFGVIAGDFTLSPLAHWLLPGASDGTVPLASTKLAGMNDFLIVHSRHTLMLWRKQTLQAVRTYLETGHFRQAAQAKTPTARASSTLPVMETHQTHPLCGQK